MTQLKDITATPHPTGNRIDLTWVNPEPMAYPGVRIVRRERTYPTVPEDGILALEADDLAFTTNEEGERTYSATDRDIKGETVYYYTLFPYSGDPPQYSVDANNRTAAMATAPYDYGAWMFSLLPGIYHRYDTAAAESPPDGLSAEDQDKGPLQRSLNLTGAELDQFHSFARAAIGLHDIDEVDGRLLPLLADWIAWPTDYRLELDAQRNELRRAPYIYETIGIIPTIEATVKRVLGWESRTKEFAQNVVLSNQPERLNLWLLERAAGGQWSSPTEPLSINFAYEGRPTAVTDTDGTLWVFYHTQRKQQKGTWSNEVGLATGDAAKKWVRKGQWDIWYKTYREDVGWSPSRPLTNRRQIDKHPSAVLHGGTLWVFWETWSETDRLWRIAYSTLEDGTWSDPVSPWESGAEQREPWAVTDDQGGLWLFWRERDGLRWDLKYNRHDGTDWELPVSSPGSFREDDEDPRVEGDVFVQFHPSDPTRRIWVFWARREQVSPAAHRWRITYRTKADLDPTIWNWSAIETLPAVDPDASDREPAVLWGPDGNPELFWASNRDRSWSVWRSRLDLGGLGWNTPEALTGNPFSQRGPVPASANGRTLLFYRSNESLKYSSETYRATHTLDNRYGGSTTLDTRNIAKSGLRKSYLDFQTYTWDAGAHGERGERNWYAHDTVGLYLTPLSEDPSLIIRERNVIENVLRQFLPIQVRVVLVIAPVPYKEQVYTYAFPGADAERVIGEQVFDSTIPELYGGLADEHTDTVPGWVWVYSWSETTPNHRTVDFDADPIDTSQRTWHIGVEPGE